MDLRAVRLSGPGRDGARAASPGSGAPAGLSIYLLGSTHSELGGSEFAEVVLGKVSGMPPALDLAAEARLHVFLQECSRQDLLASSHDLSDGGLAVALAESAMAGGVGFTVAAPADGLAAHAALFSESASRVLVTAREGREAELEEKAGKQGVPITRLGLTGGTRIEFAGLFDVPLTDAVVVYEGTIP